MHNHDDVGRDDVPRQGCAGDDAEAAESDTGGDAERDGDPQAPGADGAAGDLFGLERNCYERRFRNRRRKANRRGKRVDQQVVVPVDAVGHAVRPYGRRRGELNCHDFADREERLLQADEKEREPQQDEDGSDRDSAQIGQPLPKHDDLKKHEDCYDRRNVERG